MSERRGAQQPEKPVARRSTAVRYYARTMQILSEWAMRAFHGLGRDQW
jgi:hypothetical protein